MPRVTIDGCTIDCADGTTVLDAARSAGIDIPSLCHDDRLEPTGACRICLVEEEGARRPVPACTTLIHDGLSIRTTSPVLTGARGMMLDFLAADYPAAPLPDGSAKPFLRLLAANGIAPGGPASAPPPDDSHPYIRVDMSRCIECFRCVRICDEVQGQRVWHVRNRGRDTVILPDGPSLAQSTCVACGACVDACPTGALEDRSVVEHGAATSWTRTVCPYCGVGCELDYGTRDGRLVASRPVMGGPVNNGHACVKGRYAFAFVHASDRVTTPLLRDAGEWRPASWPEAIDAVAGGLRQVIARRGPDAVGVLGSARATNEENYLAQKLARYALGTNNVDCCARVCHAPSAAALKRALGAGAATNSFDDIERARTILVCGANPTENHPVVGARIRQAARRGAHLIVVDPRRIELAAVPGALHLAPRPGTNLALLNAMAHVIVEEQLTANEFLERHVDGLSDLRASLADWAPDRAAAVCGVAPEDIRRAARLYASEGPSMMFHGLGVTEHVQGTDGVAALINLALLTGNIGRAGGGVNPLRGQNNVQGAAQMGCDPAVLTGGVAIDQARDRFAALWGRPLPRTRGLTLPEMMAAARAGSLKALIVIGYDILLTNPDAAATRRALEALDLLIVVDMFRTETSALAHIFLPACSSFEKDGTFMNAERRIQRVRAVMPPMGESHSDAEIVCRLAAALGCAPAFAFPDVSAIWNEVRDAWPAVRGITYERLESSGLQWPCPAEDHPGTPILYRSGFAEGPARLRPVDFEPSPETTTPGYPLLLMTGRTLYAFNAGTMTGRTANRALRPVDLLEISQEDAAALRLRNGQRVAIVSAYGRAVLPLTISSRVVPGQLFATFHTGETFLNRVTSGRHDAIGTPEYKVTAVRLEPVASPAMALA